MYDRGRPPVDVVLAMLAKAAFLHVKLDGRATGDHTVNAITSHPEMFERVLNLKVNQAADIMPSLSGTVDDVLGGASDLLDQTPYYMDHGGKLWSADPSAARPGTENE